MGEETAVAFLFVAPAIWGLLAGLIEIFFVIGDEGGMHPLVHGLHALPISIIFSYISFNAIPVGNYLANYISFFGNPIVSTYLIPFLIGIIATIKVKSAASIISGGHTSVGERLPHALLVGFFIALGPFIWPFLAPILPSFMNM